MADNLNETDKEAVKDASQRPGNNPPKNTKDPVSGDKGVKVKEVGGTGEGESGDSSSK